MGRKRKQIDLEGVCKSNLPPCRVCYAPGAGFHYGANTCEACKGFFHRSLKIRTQYKCDGDGNCVIEHGQNRLCQYCRYQKCLSVGMAKEAIKTGRYTSVKRTNDILEIKRLQLKKGDRHIDQPGNESDDSSLDFDDKKGQIFTRCASGVNLNLPDSPSSCTTVKRSMSPCLSPLDQILTDNENQSSHGRISSVAKEKETSTAALQEIECLFSESPEDPYQHQLHSHYHLQASPSSSTASPSSNTSSYGSPPNNIALKPRKVARVDSPLLSLSSITLHSRGPSPTAPLPQAASSSMSPPVSPPMLSLPSPGSTAPSPASTVASAASPLSILSQSGIDILTSDSPDFMCDLFTQDTKKLGVTELYRDKDMVVKTLVEADENYMVPLFGKLTDKEIKQQQQEHFEACRLQREMFGALRRLPDHEYDYIFATTGLDTDDRQKRLRLMSTCLEKMIQAMVKFSKNIPGFYKLDIADKVKLIKYSRQEFCLFTIYKFIDSEKKIMRGLDNQWKCEFEMSRMNTDSDTVLMETLDLHFKFCHSLQSLKLSDEELAVIRAIIVMAPDRETQISSPLAREIHWQLNKCLIHLLSQRYKKPLSMYARIVGRLTEARSQTENMIRFFRRLKIDKYSNVLNNPLLKEMCNGIFFDCKDEDDFHLTC